MGKSKDKKPWFTGVQVEDELKQLEEEIEALTAAEAEQGSTDAFGEVLELVEEAGEAAEDVAEAEASKKKPKSKPKDKEQEEEVAEEAVEEVPEEEEVADAPPEQSKVVRTRKKVARSVFNISPDGRFTSAQDMKMNRSRVEIPRLQRGYK